MHKQSVLIVGASREVGLAVVKQLSTPGKDVVATWHATRPEKMGSNIIWLQTDIMHRDSILSLKSACAGRYFDLILVNVGIYGPKHQNPDFIDRK